MNLVCGAIDFFILEHDDVFPIFFGIAMIISNREILLAAKPEDVPNVMSSICVDKQEEIDQLLSHGKALCNEGTPMSAKNQLVALYYPTSGMGN